VPDDDPTTIGFVAVPIALWVDVVCYLDEWGADRLSDALKACRNVGLAPSYLPSRVGGAEYREPRTGGRGRPS
jgi:hypothetical protein